MNTWHKPTFVELCMNAEIGAYQEDPGEEREPPVLSTLGASRNPAVTCEAPETEASRVA
jgi:hypothetical protein